MRKLKSVFPSREWNRLWAFSGLALQMFLVQKLAAEVDWPQLKCSLITSSLPNELTHVTSARDNSGRLFVVSKTGQIRIVKGTNVLATPFLNIGDRVTAYDEGGLLSVAFSPGFATNHSFFVCYNRSLDAAVTISRFATTVVPDVADSASEQVLLAVPHACCAHNGGQLAFGPDGFLYASIGDGGETSQNLMNHLGKILRINPDSNGGYSIPPNNPFVGQADKLPEIWAYGLRNPWRFSFDRVTGDLYIADVGFTAQEEVDFQTSGSPGGRNYGWPFKEGTLDAQAPPPGFDTNELTMPILSLPHSSCDCIIGGHVCRAANSSRMSGIYFYADWWSGRLFGLKFNQGVWQMALLNPIDPAGGDVSSFGEDEDGNIYIVRRSTGDLYRIEDSGMALPPEFEPGAGVINNTTVLLKSPTPGSVIRYTLEPRNPTAQDAVFNPAVPILITNGATIRAQAFRNDLLPSLVSTGTFVLKVATPQFQPPSGAFPSNTLVAINCTTSNAVIHYTLDGSDPSENSSIFTGPIVINGSLQLKAQAFRNGFGQSQVATANYDIAAVATPQFAPSQQVGFGLIAPITNGTTITISTTTSGSKIYYTLDGTTPTRNSTQYSGPFSIQGNTQVLAFGTHADYRDSEVASIFFPLILPERTVVNTIAGSGREGFRDGRGIEAQFLVPRDLCINDTGYIYVADEYNHRVREISPSGEVRTIAGSGGYDSLDGVGTNASFDDLVGICFDQHGSIYVAEAYGLVRKIDASFSVTTVANFGGIPGGIYGIAADQAGDVYFSGWDGISRIRPDGSVETFYGGGYGFCLDAQTNVFGAYGSVVYRYSATGNATQLAGSWFAYGMSDGSGAGARFQWAGDIALDASDNLLICDETRVRKLGTNGLVTTLAGNGIRGLASGPGSEARFAGLNGICIDQIGNVYVADSFNHRICRISIDEDGDRIPDFMETIGSGYTPGVDDSQIDTDGDGQSNAAEYIAGTDPLSAASNFRIKEVRRVGNSVVISWDGAYNRYYELLKSSNLTSWSVVTNKPVSSNGPVAVSIAISPAQNASFYRLSVSMP